MSNILDDFGVGVTASGKVKRYTLDPARTLTLTEGSAGALTHLERIGAGVLTAKPLDGGFLVHERGDAQMALPLRAVGNAVLSGDVIPFDVLATMLVRTGKSAAFKRELDAAIKAAKEATASA